MAKLYIANCTNQVQQFLYRLPETPSARMMVIEIGQQALLAEDLNPMQIESIVGQHAKYGMVAVADIDRTRPFIGLCYQVDKKIDMVKIQRAAEHNVSVLEHRGEELRKISAVAANNELEKAAGGLNKTRVSFQEDVQDGGKPKVNDGFDVQSTGENAPPPPVNKRRSKRGAAAA